MHPFQGIRPLAHDVTAGQRLTDKRDCLDRRVLGEPLAGDLAEPAVLDAQIDQAEAFLRELVVARPIDKSVGTGVPENAQGMVYILNGGSLTLQDTLPSVQPHTFGYGVSSMGDIDADLILEPQAKWAEEWIEFRRTHDPEKSPNRTIAEHLTQALGD